MCSDDCTFSALMVYSNNSTDCTILFTPVFTIKKNIFSLFLSKRATLDTGNKLLSGGFGPGVTGHLDMTFTVVYVYIHVFERKTIKTKQRYDTCIEENKLRRRRRADSVQTPLNEKVITIDIESTIVLFQSLSGL